MSEIDQVIERKLKELRGLGAPTLQRVYWAIGSVVGAIAVVSILLPFIEVLRFEYLQLILISFSVALIIAVISFRPRTRVINWLKILDELADIRDEVENPINKKLYQFERSSPSEKRNEAVLWTLRGVKILILYTRVFYRLALVEGKSDLANDFQKEMDELGGLLITLEKHLTPSK